MDWESALEASGILVRLAPFDPRVAGTFPLGLAVPGSDIDVLCHAPDADAFSASLWGFCRDFEGFSLRQWRGQDRPVIATFTVHGVPFELFGQARPVDAQHGWRHFEVERRLLALGGATLQDSVRTARRAGAKTELAFAQVLGLAGDPYAALFDLSAMDDTGLQRIVATWRERSRTNPPA